jgi:hypothetical protein
MYRQSSVYPAFLEARLNDVWKVINFQNYLIPTDDPNYNDYITKMETKISQSCPGKLEEFKIAVGFRKIGF